MTQDDQKGGQVIFSLLNDITKEWQVKGSPSSHDAGLYI